VDALWLEDRIGFQLNFHFDFLTVNKLAAPCVRHDRNECAATPDIARDPFERFSTVPPDNTRALQADTLTQSSFQGPNDKDLVGPCTRLTVAI
jgi:hypothetical protein